MNARNAGEAGDSLNAFYSNEVFRDDLLEKVIWMNGSNSDIEKQMGLISYKGLAKVIAGLNDAEAWEVIGNAFNPTFEEVKAGKLEKEE